MNTLDQWEAEAKKFRHEPDETKHPYGVWESNERILALIDLVRKKDEALHSSIMELNVFALTAFKDEAHSVRKILLDGLKERQLTREKALALTEELK